MLPKKLKDWDIETIKRLLEKGYYETLYFDFKEKLPHRSDDGGKLRLIQTCCAFSNSNGGFLVFGISDNRSENPDERLIGIDSTIDFPEQFGNYPMKCTPIINWDFLNPPIKLPNNKYIHIIEIHKSFNSPIGYLQDNKWYFPIRTNQGNETMTYSELKYGFLNFYEKKLKLNLMLSELTNIEKHAKMMQIREEHLENRYNTITFDISILQTLLGDSYSLLAEEHKLVSNLQEIRNICTMVNKRVDLLLNFVEMPLSNLNVRIREHNKFLNKQTNILIPIVIETIDLLKSFLEK